MYNTLNPINIIYRKPQNARSGGLKNLENKQEQVDSYKGENQKKENTSTKKPDYTKNSVNIAQVLGDFKNTITAINAPQDVKQKVDLELAVVEEETKKETPSRQVILSGLKNASKVADKYIADALKKPSKVVEGWVDAVFMQNVVLKADSSQINDKFKINFPEKALKKQGTSNLNQNNFNIAVQKTLPYETQKNVQAQPIELSREEQLDILFPKDQENLTSFEEEETDEVQNQNGYYSNITPEITQAFTNAKEYLKNNQVENAMDLYDKALQIAQQSALTSVEAAIHYEKGRVYDDREDVTSALNEYHQATMTEDNNLKTQAHLRMARIYDDYIKYEPAINNYHKAIAFSGEANNPEGQTVALKDLTGLFAQRFDKDNTMTFGDLTLESADECSSAKTKGSAYSNIAHNYEYIGEEKKALECYKGAVQTYEANEQSPYEIAQNYLDASNLMKKLGNKTKAANLLSKYYQYLELAQQSLV